MYYVLSKVLLHKLKIDDPLDAIAVHAGGGMWGMIGCAAFASKDLVNGWYPALEPNVSIVDGNVTITEESRPYGFVMGGDGTLLAAHLVYILVIAGWTMAIMVPFFILLKKMGIMRVPPEVEVQGLDVSYHGGHSYPNGEAHVQLPPLNTGNHMKYTMEELINEALREVEARGWHPPSSPSGDKGGLKKTSADTIASASDGGKNLDGDGEERSQGQGEVRPPSSALDTMRSKMRALYSSQSEVKSQGDGDGKLAGPGAVVPQTQQAEVAPRSDLDSAGI